MEYEGMTDQERRAVKWAEVWGSSSIPAHIDAIAERHLDVLIECERLAVERDYGRY